MEFVLTKISGIDDAMVSLRMSKRAYTKEVSNDLRELVRNNLDNNGFATKELDERYIQELKKLEKYGIEFNHNVLLKFIDFTIETTGLHRGAQD